MSALKQEQHREKITYEDYFNMPDDGNRYEVIDGELYMMAAPFTKHQRISGRIFLALGNFLRGKRCEVFHAPFDVRLPLRGGKKIHNVVQPDLAVYCNQLGIDERGGRLAPDIIIEILSKSTARMDRIRKLKLYESAGVKEYWIVDPANELIEVYHLENKVYSLPPTLYEIDDTIHGADITCPDFEGFSLDLSQIFQTTPQGE